MKQYEEAISICKNLFLQKFEDYNDAWKMLRKISIADQLYIKTIRIRTIENSNINKVGEPILNEYIALVNYSIIALILNENNLQNRSINLQEAEDMYNKYSEMAFAILRNKNHDYSDIWKEIDFTSITDIILMKILRIRSIIKNAEKLIEYECLEANYIDIINYAVFYIIRLQKL
ncbi:MAG: DUF1599 domain-containing protein [Solitalea-like symbiont of Acarus siro]